MMKALRLSKEDPSSPTPTLTLTDQAIPQPKPGEILVKIHAAAIQPADILNAQGGFEHTTFPRTPGRDFAGTIVGVGDDGDNDASWRGKQVFGTSGSAFSFTRDGAQAEYAIVPSRASVAEKPHGLSFVQAASLATPLTTANLTLRRAGLRKGKDVVMVLGASGSVGSLVVQIARAHGCQTIAVGRHAGADVNTSSDPQLLSARALSASGKGPDIVVDTVGDLALVRAAFNVMNDGGRLAVIAAPRGGASTELGVDVLSLYRRQISLVGCNSVAETQEAMAGMLAELGRLFDTGVLAAPKEEGMNAIRIDEASEAYAGKIKKAVIVFD